MDRHIYIKVSFCRECDSLSHVFVICDQIPVKNMTAISVAHFQFLPVKDVPIAPHSSAFYFFLFVSLLLFLFILH